MDEQEIGQVGISRHNLLDIITTDEYGLYSGGWTKKEITPESFSHPAKAARKLVRWIYDHAMAEGWLHPGDVVIDPFFGIGGVALDGMAEGAIVVGVELERHFVDMARGCDCTGISTEDLEDFKGRLDEGRYLDGRHWCPACMSRAKSREREGDNDQLDMFDVFPPHHYEGNVERWARWGLPGKAIVIQGDSRRLAGVLGKIDWAELGLGSPPYSTSGAANQGGQQRGGAEHLYDVEGDKYGISPENLGNMATGSPPYSEGLGHKGRASQTEAEKGYPSPKFGDYGTSEGQLGSMREGDLSIASPPFATAETRDRSPTQPGSVSDAITRAYTKDRQGAEEGNLSHMPMGDMTVSSPSFGKQQSGGGIARDGTPAQRRSSKTIASVGYQRQGVEEGNLASMEMGELDIPAEFIPPEFSVLREHVESWKEGGDLVISSSPYANSVNAPPAANDSEARIERKKKAGIDTTQSRNIGGPNSVQRQAQVYGASEGQLGAMPPGDLVVSSSPFAQSIGSDDPAKRGGLYRDPKRAQDVNLTGSYGQSEGQLGTMACGSPPYAGSLKPETPAQVEAKQGRIAKAKSIHDGRQLETDSPGKAAMGGGYGVEAGQLGSMDEGQLAVSSPPFCGSELTKDNKFAEAVARDKRGGSRLDTSIGSYDTEGQPDIESANTFWSAARLILRQLHQVLRPDAHAIWVVKPFVRNKSIVDFPGQWRQLCESCGFRTLHMHTCWQIEHGAVQLDFDGNEHQETKERISFFRRLYNKKYPHNAINWEIVWCMERI